MSACAVTSNFAQLGESPIRRHGCFIQSWTEPIFAFQVRAHQPSRAKLWSPRGHHGTRTLHTRYGPPLGSHTRLGERHDGGAVMGSAPSGRREAFGSHVDARQSGVAAAGRLWASSASWRGGAIGDRARRRDLRDAARAARGRPRPEGARVTARRWLNRTRGAASPGPRGSPHPARASSRDGGRPRRPAVRGAGSEQVRASRLGARARGGVADRARTPRGSFGGLPQSKSRALGPGRLGSCMRFTLIVWQTLSGRGQRAEDAKGSLARDNLDPCDRFERRLVVEGRFGQAAPRRPQISREIFSVPRWRAHARTTACNLDANRASTPGRDDQ